jgi:hypothetical protein
MKSAGVSEVIGTLILVGVVVVGIALVGVLLLSNPTPSKVPTFDAIVSNSSKTIYIYHKGGDTLWKGQYKILVDGGDQTGNFSVLSPGSEPWSVGDTLTATAPSVPKSMVMIFNNSWGGGSVLFAVDFTKENTNPAFVQTAATYTSTGTNPLTLTFSQASTAGNLIVLSSDWGSQAINIASITDSKANAYILAVGPTNAGATARGVTYYAKNIAGGGAAITITVTLTGAPPASPSFEIYATEYSGIATGNPLDRISSGTGAGTTMNSGSNTTTQSPELIYGFGWSYGTSLPDPPYTARSTFRGNFIAERIVSSTGTYSVTGFIDASNSWFCHMATFKKG